MFRLYRHLHEFTRQFSTCIVASERQKHGFIYQKNVIKKHNLLEQQGYTAEYDALYKNIPVQIKCSKYGSSLEMGDYTRNKKKSKDFILAIGLWQSSYKHEPKLITNEYMLYIDHNKYVKHLGYFDEYIETLMYEDFRQISNDVRDDVIWKRFCHKYKLCWKKDNRISVRFKRDHKKQKRIQCAVSWRNFNDWLLKDFQHISLDVSRDHEINNNDYLIL